MLRRNQLFLHPTWRWTAKGVKSSRMSPFHFMVTLSLLRFASERICIVCVCIDWRKGKDLTRFWTIQLSKPIQSVRYFSTCWVNSHQWKRNRRRRLTQTEARKGIGRRERPNQWISDSETVTNVLFVSYFCYSKKKVQDFGYDETSNLIVIIVQITQMFQNPIMCLNHKHRINKSRHNRET